MHELGYGSVMVIIWVVVKMQTDTELHPYVLMGLIKCVAMKTLTAASIFTVDTQKSSSMKPSSPHSLSRVCHLFVIEQYIKLSE